MGLDMYLNRKFYVQNWDHTPKEQRHSISIRKGGKASGIPVKKIMYVITQEIYWRKANAIHKWFVDNCQDGKDECQEAYVSREKLVELRDVVGQVLDGSVLVPGKVSNGYMFEKDKKGNLVKKHNWVEGKTIKDPSVAQTLLPTTSGCFFGGTEYDQYYYEDLVFTKKELDRLLAEPDDSRGEFYYQSSW